MLYIGYRANLNRNVKNVTTPYIAYCDSLNRNKL